MRRAFTLVEMLIVIGIIAVLTGLLMPALARVRRQALCTQCATNLRSLGAGWFVYAGDNNGIICPGRLPIWDRIDSVYGLGDTEQYRPRWYELLGVAVQKYPTHHTEQFQDDAWTVENPLFLCPAAPDWRNSRNYPYGYNYQFLGNARRRPDGTWIRFPVKTSSIQAASTVMAMDGLGTAAGKPRAARTGYYADGTHDEFAVCNKGWAIDPPRLKDDSDYADPQHRQPDDRAGPDARHDGRVNTLFCDGHVDALTPQELGYVVLPDGSMPAANPAATNRLFSGNGADADPPSVR